jgi:hypothetical protein
MAKSKPTKFLFASDSHGDLACEDSLKALWEYKKDFKPDITIGGGDHFDLRSIRKGAMGDKEGAESMQFDLDCGFDFLRKLQPTHLLKGNHEFRLEAMARTHPSGLVRDYCQKTDDDINRVARKAGCKVIIPYHGKKILRIGPLSFHHGIGSNLLKAGKHFTAGGVMGGAYICGHGHTGQQINLPQFGGGAALMAPCLARIDDMHYSQNCLGTAQHDNGFIAGWFMGDEWRAWIIRRIGKDKWVWQTDLKVWSSKK